MFPQILKKCLSGANFLVVLSSFFSHRDPGGHHDHFGKEIAL